jgi:RNA polymerase sigma-70 factor (ECF subfamily)
MPTRIQADDTLQMFDSQRRLASLHSGPASPDRAPDAHMLSETTRDDEAALVRRICTGDSAAFAELVARYQSRVFSLIWGILRDPNHVEDVAQQVFAKVFFSISRFDARSSLYTWIHKIAVNECYDFLRKKRARKIVYECEAVGSEDQLSPLESAVDCTPVVEDRLEQRDLTFRLLEGLSPEDRRLLLLKEVDGYSVDELVALTGMNENTIKVRLFRARKKAAAAARRLARPAAPPASADRNLQTPCFVN